MSDDSGKRNNKPANKAKGLSFKATYAAVLAVAILGIILLIFLVKQIFSVFDGDPVSQTETTGLTNEKTQALSITLETSKETVKYGEEIEVIALIANANAKSVTVDLGKCSDPLLFIGDVEFKAPCENQGQLTIPSGESMSKKWKVRFSDPRNSNAGDNSVAVESGIVRIKVKWGEFQSVEQIRVTD